jgi:N-acetylmuramoyl-L-alanine amidase
VGNIYLTWMADDLEAAGLQVVRYQGWTTRARSSGGYSGQPLCLMWHHTASQTSAENDCYYMCHSSGDRPICNLYIARDGAVWVLAAGATNTNGKGQAMDFSRGSVPKDQMNQWAVGMELGNSGTGESYPQAQIDAAFTTSNVINRRLGNQLTDVCTHQHYAPDRKIDPAKGSAVLGPWCPTEINSSGTWDVADLRNECGRRGGGSIPIPPSGDDVEKYLVRDVHGYPWVTDFASYATSITEEQAEDGVRYRGYVKGSDNEPFPISESDTDLMHRLAAK